MTHFLSLLQHSSPPKSGSGVDHKKIVMLPNTTATVLDPPTSKTHRPTHTHTHERRPHLNPMPVAGKALWGNGVLKIAMVTTFPVVSRPN